VCHGGVCGPKKVCSPRARSMLPVLSALRRGLAGAGTLAWAESSAIAIAKRLVTTTPEVPAAAVSAAKAPAAKAPLFKDFTIYRRVAKRHGLQHHSFSLVLCRHHSNSASPDSLHVHAQVEP
jgi:hypothetical protein